MARGLAFLVAVILIAGAALMMRSSVLSSVPDRLRIGYAVEAPYAFVVNGTVTGESPEVARHVAARLGITDIEWRVVDFDALIQELEEGRIDVIAAGMFITPERARRVAFSAPTFQVGPGLMVPRGNPLDLHSYADLVARADLRVAVLSGSVEEDLLWRKGLPEERMVRVPDAQTGRVAVNSGLVQALPLSMPTVRWLSRTDPSGRTEPAEPFSISSTMATVSHGGFAFRPEDDALRAAWDAELRRFIGSPEHLALVAAFGFSPDDLPRMTTMEVLKP
jgi:polar amino acid transport system substrate-binding protein